MNYEAACTCRAQLASAQERIRVDAIGKTGVGVGVKSGGANGTLERGHPVPPKRPVGLLCAAVGLY